MVDQECENYMRIDKLLGIGTDTLREKFTSNIRPSTCEDYFNKNRHQIYHLWKPKTCIHCTSGNSGAAPLVKKQWEKIFQASSNPCSKSIGDCWCGYVARSGLTLAGMDITLISCLLLNILQLSQCDKNYVKNIRKLRNIVAHEHPNKQVPDAVFEKLWKDCSDNIRNLATTCSSDFANQINERIKNLRSTVLGENRQITELQKTVNRMPNVMSMKLRRVTESVQNEGRKTRNHLQGKLKGEIASSESRMKLRMDKQKKEIIKEFKQRPVDWKRKQQLEGEIERSRQEIEGKRERTKFVQTRTFDSALNLLKGNTRFLIFIGLSGDGKTTIGNFLVHRLVEPGGIDNHRRYPLVIDTPAEFKRLVSCNENLVIFIDNMFGTLNVHQQVAEDWKTIFPHMSACLNDTTNPNCNYLIVCIRKNIFNECLTSVLSKLDIYNDDCVIDLQSERYCLTDTEKENIFYSFPVNASVKKNDIISVCHQAKHIGFPQCCKLFSGSKATVNLRFMSFENPRGFLDSEFKSMLRGTQRDKLGFCVLSIVMFMGGKLYSDQCRVNSMSPDDKAMLHSVLTMCGLDFKDSISADILDLAHSFKGVYLKHEQPEDAFSFEHDCLHETMAMVLYERDPGMVIKYCRINFLSSLTIDKHNTCGLFVSQKLYTEIITRIEKELDKPGKRELFIALAEMNLWGDRGFLELFKNKILVCFPTILQSSKFKEEVTSLMICAAEVGNINLVRFLHGYDPQQVTNSKHALNKAVEMGKEAVLKFFLTFAKPDIDTAQSAVRSGNIDILKQIMGLCACSEVDIYKLFFIACEEFREDIVRFLYSEHSRILNKGDENKWTALHWAVKQGSLSLTKYLIENGAGVFELTDNHMNILHIACQNGHLGVATYLINKYSNLLHMKDKDNKSAIHWAAYSGIVSLVEMLIERGSDVFAMTTIRETVLHIACEKGHTELVKMLSEKYNGLLSMTDKDNMTVLHYAAMSGNVSLVETLIESGVDVFAVKSDGKTSLLVAAINGHTELVKLLSEKYNGLLSMNDKEGLTVLHCAACSGNVALVETLIELDSDVFAVTTVGQTVLHIACEEGQTELVKMLSANFNKLLSMTDNDNRTVLHYAAISGNVSLAEVLIELGLDVFALTTIGQTVLHIACEEGHSELVKMLSEKYNRLLSITGNNNMAVLHYAAMSGNVQLVETLIKAGADMFAVTTSGQTVLHIASQNGHTELVKMLSAKYNGLLSMTDNNNWTALHYAATTGNVQFVETLIEAGVDVFAVTSSDKQTVLQIACLMGQTDLVKMFSAKYNGLLSITGINNKTVLHYAAVIGNVQLVETLIESGADVFAVTSDGQTVLHFASQNGHTELVKMLSAKYNGLLSMTDNDNWTVLHYAAKSGNVQLVETLIDSGVDVFAVTSVGKTILHVASERGDTELAKMLSEKYNGLLSMTDNENMTVLHYAAISGNVSLAEALIELHSDVFAFTTIGKTVLHIACQEGHTELVKMLSEKYNGLLSITGKNNMTVLHYAAMSGNVSLAEALIELGLDVFALTTSGQTVLHIACQNGHTELVNMLSAKYNGLLSIIDEDYLTVLHYAAMSGNVHLVETLIESGVDVFAVTTVGHTVLHIACLESHTKLVKMLSEKYNGLLSMTENNNMTVLHCAAMIGNVSLVETLIESDVDVFAVTSDGKTSLLVAAINGHTELAKLLSEKYNGLLSLNDKEGLTVLHCAAMSGNVSLVETLVELGSDVFAVATDGQTLLHIACQEGQTDLVKMLSANYNGILSMTDNDNRTVLHYAAISGNVSLAEALIVLGLDVFALTTIGQTVLHIACEEGHSELVKMLSANFNKLLSMTDNDNRTVLHYAAISGNVSLAEVLIELGLDVFALTTIGQTVLHIACEEGHSELVKMLSEKYKRLLSITGNNNMAVLHYAAMSGNVQLVETLIKAGADMFAVTTSGQTVLHIASQNGHTELVKMLSANYTGLLSMTDNDNWTVLHYAAKSGNVQLVETLIDSGVDVFAVTSVGKTILHVASERGDTELAKMLSEKYNGLLSMTDNENMTVLHYAAISGNVSLAEALIELHSDVFAFTTIGQTVLHIACQEGHTELVKMLSEKYNGLLSITGKNNMTVLHYAAMSGNVSLAEALIELGLDVFALTTSGQTVLHIACQNGHTELVNMLSAKYNGLLSIIDEDYLTVLHYAAMSGNVHLVETLIESGVDVFAVTTVGHTVLHIACLECHTKLVKMLSEKYNGLLSMTENNNMTVLHCAAMIGNVSLVETLIESDVDVFAVTSDGKTSLLVAAINGHTELAKLLSEKYNGLLSLNDKEGLTVLHCAAMSGNVSLVETLVELGSDVFAVATDGQTLLHIACQEGQTDLVKMLSANYNGILSMTDNDNRTVLHYAAISGNVSLAEALIVLGLDVFALTTIGQTVLHIACEEGHSELVKMLSANFNKLLSMTDNDNRTVLHYAAISGNVSLAEVLIELGLDVFALTTIGQTVLHIACEEGHSELVKMLSEKYNRLLSITGNNNMAVLHYAAMSGNVQLVETLIKAGADMFAVTTSGQTVLHIASQNGHTELVKMLSAKYIGLLSMTDNNNWTALHYAATTGNVQLVETLIEAGVDVFAVTSSDGQTVLQIACLMGQTDLVKMFSAEYNRLLSITGTNNKTVLHYAAVIGNVQFVETLIESGADVFAVTSVGQTVLHIACEVGKTDMVKMLSEKYNGLLSMTDKDNMTVLHYAAASGNVSLAEVLIDLGVDVFAVTSDGQTVLHFACEEGQTDLVKMLSANYNGLLSMTDNDNWTVLHYAAKSGNVQLVETLIESGVDVFALTTFEESVLDIASETGHTELTKMLTEKYNLAT